MALARPSAGAQPAAFAFQRGKRLDRALLAGLAGSFHTDHSPTVKDQFIESKYISSSTVMNCHVSRTAERQLVPQCHPRPTLPERDVCISAQELHYFEKYFPSY